MIEFASFVKESERQTKKSRIHRCLFFFQQRSRSLSLSVSLSLESSRDGDYDDEALDDARVIAGRDGSASASRRNSGPKESVPKSTAASTNRRFRQRLSFFPFVVSAQAPRRLRLRRRLQPPRDPRGHAGRAGGRRRGGEEEFTGEKSSHSFFFRTPPAIEKTTKTKKLSLFNSQLLFQLNSTTGRRLRRPRMRRLDLGPGPGHRDPRFPSFGDQGSRESRAEEQGRGGTRRRAPSLAR